MPRYSSIVTALIARLAAHNATGQLLDGFKLVTLPVKEVDGQTELAGGVLRLYLPTIRERAHDQLAIVSGGSISIDLAVSTWRDSGIAAHVLAVEKAMDAVELNGSTIDLLLGATLAKPIEVSQDGAPWMVEDGALSMNTRLKISMVPRAVKSGGRHL